MPMAPVPFPHCDGSIYRRTAGGHSSAVNLGAKADTSRSRAAKHVGVHQALIREDDGECRISSGRPHWCFGWGSAL